jgi:predicted  nucleic acid-binding Zn-ribbon protein
MEEKLATVAEENTELARLKDQLQRLRQDNDEAEQEVVQMTVSRAYLSTYISTLRKKHRLSFNSAHHVVCDLARS